MILSEVTQSQKGKQNNLCALPHMRILALLVYVGTDVHVGIEEHRKRKQEHENIRV